VEVSVVIDLVSFVDSQFYVFCTWWWWRLWFQIVSGKSFRLFIKLN